MPDSAAKSGPETGSFNNFFRPEQTFCRLSVSEQNVCLFAPPSCHRAANISLRKCLFPLFPCFTVRSMIYMDNKILRVYMAGIRRKIESDPNEPKYIFTEVGVGYRMAENDEDA